MPGESICFDAKIDNKSDSKLSDVSVKLVQEIRLLAKEKPKSEKNECKPLFISKRVEPNTIERWKDTYPIPEPIDQSLKGLCRIVEVNYFFVLRIKIGLLSMSKELSMPITIGTISIDPSSSSPLPDEEFIQNDLINLEEGIEFEDEPPPSYDFDQIEA